MRTSVLSFVFVAAVSAAPAIAASAEAERLTLSLSAQTASRAAIVVAGSNGRYDRIEQSDINAALTLSAQPSTEDDGYKIVASRLHLKADGAGSAGADTLGVAPFSGSQSASDSYRLSLAANGPLAQDAIALCNAVPTAERSGTSDIKRAMALAITWRVTTGRFSFKWTNYDRVAPSEEIQRNPDFYADQVTQDAETLIDADVSCQPLAGAAVAAKPAAENAVKRVALTAAPAETAKPVQTVSLNDAGKPRCDGGMVRQISSTAENYLCLCPGNTTRVETGANAFACERRARR